jgi:hypothetical protein
VSDAGATRNVSAQEKALRPGLRAPHTVGPPKTRRDDLVAQDALPEGAEAFPL